MVKKFALVSFGVLCLAVAALIGNTLTTPKADAQAGQTIVGYAAWNDQNHYVITANGDVFRNTGYPQSAPFDCNGVPYYPFDCGAVYIGNIWTGTPPVGTDSGSWGKIKSKFNPK
jgi:hypothetical protein